MSDITGCITSFIVRECEPRFFENFISKTSTRRGKEKILWLDVAFIRRFVWHISLAGFQCIRHYGLHHPLTRGKLSLARRALGLDPAVPEAEEFSLWDWLVELFGEDEVNRCPYCGAPHSESSVFAGKEVRLPKARHRHRHRLKFYRFIHFLMKPLLIAQKLR